VYRTPHVIASAFAPVQHLPEKWDNPLKKRRIFFAFMTIGLDWQQGIFQGRFFR
jgi:hypothetical protein